MTTKKAIRNQFDLKDNEIWRYSHYTEVDKAWARGVAFGLGFVSMGSFEDWLNDTLPEVIKMPQIEPTRKESKVGDA